MLTEGDRVASLSGEWVRVEEVFDTGLYEPVYNLRVAEYHTYFVGDEGWGFALWAHNAYMPHANQQFSALGNSYVRSARELYAILRSHAPSVAGTIAYSVSTSDPETAYVYVFYRPATMTTAQAEAFRNEFTGGLNIVFIPGGGDIDHAERQLFLQHRTDIAAIGISNSKGPCGRPTAGHTQATGCWKFFQDQGWENIWW